MKYYMVLNIESGRPRLENAKQLLLHHLATARRSGVKVIKLIHGYGSTGKGGVLKAGLSEMLAGMKGVSAIKGEDFSIFNAATRELIEKFPELKSDKDLDRANAGITMLYLY